MIYFCIPESEIDTANQWVRDNLDKGSGDTFVVNRKDVGSGKYALASIVDNGSAYSEGMKAQFDHAEDLPGMYASSDNAQARSETLEALKVDGKLREEELILKEKSDTVKSLVLSLGEL